MLDCGQVLAQLSNYLDDELSSPSKEALEMHLKKCDRCALVYDTTRQTLRIVSQSHTFEIPPSVSVRLRVRLHEWLAGG